MGFVAQKGLLGASQNPNRMPRPTGHASTPQNGLCAAAGVTIRRDRPIQRPLRDDPFQTRTSIGDTRNASTRWHRNRLRSRPKHAAVEKRRPPARRNAERFFRKRTRNDNPLSFQRPSGIRNGDAADRLGSRSRQRRRGARASAAAAPCGGRETRRVARKTPFASAPRRRPKIRIASKRENAAHEGDVIQGAEKNGARPLREKNPASPIRTSIL